MESLINYFGKSILYLDHATNMKEHVCVCLCVYVRARLYIALYTQTFTYIYVAIIQMNINRDTINFHKTIKYLTV